MPENKIWKKLLLKQTKLLSIRTLLLLMSNVSHVWNLKERLKIFQNITCMSFMKYKDCRWMPCNFFTINYLLIQLAINMNIIIC